MKKKSPIPSIAFGVVILVLTLLPGDNLPDVQLFTGFDKVIHFLLFFIEGYLLSNYLGTSNPKRDLLIIVIGSAFALFTELCQIFVPGRTYEGIDLGVDIIGLCFGNLIYRIKYPFDYGNYENRY